MKLRFKSYGPAWGRGAPLCWPSFDPATTEPLTEEQFSELCSELASMLESGSSEAEANQAFLLRDPTIGELYSEALAEGRTTLEAAVQKTFDRLAAMFAGAGDEHLASRGDDMRALGRALLDLTGRRETPADKGSVILLAEELGVPELRLAAQKHEVRGLLTRRGSTVSHLAVCLREMGLPGGIVSADEFEAALRASQIYLDGFSGCAHLDPDAETASRLEFEAEAFRTEMLKLSKDLPELVRRRRECGIGLFFNINSLDDARLGAETDADGVGIVRTELLFDLGAQWPSRQRQIETYTEIARLFAPRPVTFRLFDVAADKVGRLAGAEVPAGGIRGIRYFVDREELLLDQAEAILAAGKNAQVCVPMYCFAEELEPLKDFRSAGGELGVMVETPAAILQAPQLVGKVDFLSIGGNDLTAFAYGIERELMDPYLAALGLDEFFPQALIGLVELLKGAVPLWPESTCFCGQLDHDGRLLGALLGVGVKKFSIPPAEYAFFHNQIRHFFTQ